MITYLYNKSGSVKDKSEYWSCGSLFISISVHSSPKVVEQFKDLFYLIGAIQCGKPSKGIITFCIQVSNYGG